MPSQGHDGVGERASGQGSPLGGVIRCGDRRRGLGKHRDNALSAAPLRVYVRHDDFVNAAMSSVMMLPWEPSKG